MDNNEVEESVKKRKIYTKDELKALKDTELSKQWPKSLDKNCINSFGQWDPVKSFDNSIRLNETNKRNSLYENRNFRNNDFIPEKAKDDISLRPERRRWNDGCQVTLGNGGSRRVEDGHSSSGYKKPYQNNIPSGGSGDYERGRYQRGNMGGRKSESSGGSKPGLKTGERLSRNNSNLDEQQQQRRGGRHNNHHQQHSHQQQEPEWFLDGPENCEETIELHGISASDTGMLNYKVNPTAAAAEQEPVSNKTGPDESSGNKKDEILAGLGLPLRREGGSRFQDIFQKEAKASDSREVETFLKAVLSENVAGIDADKLTKVTKPLPNGVLTVEEIEKSMNCGPVTPAIQISKQQSAIPPGPTGPQPVLLDSALNLLLLPKAGTVSASSVPEPATTALSPGHQDNTKVVNWLSGLSASAKEELGDTLLPVQSPMELPTTLLSSLNHVPGPLPTTASPAGFSKFVPPIPPPPGLPLMTNKDMQQQLLHHHHQQNKFFQQHQQQQQQQNMFKSLQMSQTAPGMLNHTIQQRANNILPYMYCHNTASDNEMMSKQLGVGPPQKMDALSMANLMLSKQPHQQQKLQQQTPMHYHILEQQQQQQRLMQLANGPMPQPPGLDAATGAQAPLYGVGGMSRPIVKTAQMPISQQQQHQHFMDMGKSFQQQHSGGYNHQFMGNNNGGSGVINHAAQRPLQPTTNHHGYYNNYETMDVLGSGVRYHHQPQQQYGAGNSAVQMMQQQQWVGSPGGGGSGGSKVLANLFKVGSSGLPPLPHQAKYADQLETENLY